MGDDITQDPALHVSYPPELLEVAMSDRLERLERLRDQITEWLDGPAADRAPLALRLITVLEQIDAVRAAAPEQKGTALDEFTKRRAERQATSPAIPAKRAQRGR